MSRPEKAFASNCWYIAAWSHEIGAKPLRRRLLGRELAIFRDRDGVVALDARCPHRGGDLSTRPVVDGCLECPFHGWRFDRSGRCVHIPSQPSEQAIPGNARVSAHPSAEQQGVIWVWLGDKAPEVERPERSSFLEVPTGSRRIDVGPRLWNARFDQVVEQTIDDAHPSFVHQKALPERAHALVPKQRIVVDDDRNGFLWEADPSSVRETATPPRRALQSLVDRWVKGIVLPETRYSRLERHGLLHLHVRYANDREDILVVAATPQDVDKTWTFLASIRSRATNPLGEFYQRRFLHRLVDEDVQLVDSLLGESGDQTVEVSVKADKPSLLYRKLYAEWLEKDA